MTRGPVSIAIIGPLPPPAGGMAVHTRQMAELLASEGLRVEIVQTNAPYRPAWLARIPLVRAAARLLPYLVALWCAAGRNQLFHVMANSGWSWHLFAVPAVRLARLRGTPVVMTYHGGEAEAFLARSATIVTRTLRGVASLMVPSTFLQQIFARHGVETRIVPNVADLSSAAYRERLHQSSVRLLVARNLESVYGIETAIDTLHALRQAGCDARLSIAGSGPLLPQLKEQVERLGLVDRVTFTGRLDRTGMAELYARADILLNTSLADNMPLSLLEAMAAGIPVVSTNVGGIPHMVRDGLTAYLVPPRQPQAMAAAVLQLVGNPVAARDMAAAAHEDVKQYAWATIWPRLQQAYGAALGYSPVPVTQP